MHGVAGLDADDFLDFGNGVFRVGRRQVDLVQHRHHFHAQLDGGIAVGHRLCFHALRGIHHQQRAFARRQRAADFVAEIDVTRGIDQVQVIDLAVARLVAQGRRLRLDGNAALALQRHGIEHLGFHFAVGQATAKLDDAIGQGGLAVVDMGDDGKIAD